MMAVLGICRTRWVVRPRYSARNPSSRGTVERVWKKEWYLVPSSRSRVRTTSAEGAQATGGKDSGDYQGFSVVIHYKWDLPGSNWFQIMNRKMHNSKSCSTLSYINLQRQNINLLCMFLYSLFHDFQVLLSL